MLKTRILTGLVLGVCVVAALLLLDTVAAASVFGVIWLLGAGEWARLAGLGKVGRALYGLAFASAFTTVLGFGLSPALVPWLLWPAVLGWAVMLLYVIRYPRPVSDILVAAFGLIALTAAWVSLYWLHRSAGPGPSLVLAGLVIVWSADVGAYFAGRTFGRRSLAPAVSPNKTWEGVFGGLAAACITGVVAAWLIGLSWLPLVVLAFAVALVSIVGDLGISAFKRRAGVKDSGMLLPGHGGVLDRFDGVTAALPFYALGLQFAHVLD